VAGVVTAVGLIGSVQLYGPVGLLLIYLGSAGFGMVMLYAGLADGGEHHVPVIRIGFGAALALVVLLGAIALFPIAGWFVPAAVAATCPLVTNRLGPPSTGLTPSQRAAIDAAREQTRVDTTFQQMVESLEQADPRETDGS
jgi:hypothetical protein